MSTETPEQVAITPPTPENVADMLTAGDNDYDDGADWWPSLTADRNVVYVGITPVGQDYETKLPKVLFEAHVFAVEPPTPVAGEPVELSAELARELADSDVGDAVEGWTVVVNEYVEKQRWESVHRMIIRNEAGEHYLDTYTRGLTERQDTRPWEYEGVASFEPVECRARVVRSLEWVTPTAVQTAGGDV